jgi:hypothetical protein
MNEVVVLPIEDSTALRCKQGFLESPAPDFEVTTDSGKAYVECYVYRKSYVNESARDSPITTRPTRLPRLRRRIAEAVSSKCSVPPI